MIKPKPFFTSNHLTWPETLSDDSEKARIDERRDDEAGMTAFTWLKWMLLVAALVARENIFKINTASNFNSLKVQEMLFFEWMKRWWMVGGCRSFNAGFFDRWTDGRGLYYRFFYPYQESSFQRIEWRFAFDKTERIISKFNENRSQYDLLADIKFLNF